MIDKVEFEPKKSWNNGIPMYTPGGNTEDNAVTPENTNSEFQPSISRIESPVLEVTKAEENQVATVENKTTHISVVEDVLSQMQTKLNEIKLTQLRQSELSSKVEKLSIELAEAQADEIKEAEKLVELKIEWRELNQKLNTFGDFDVSK